jgi:hypothetical protein
MVSMQVWSSERSVPAPVRGAARLAMETARRGIFDPEYVEK